MTADYFAAEAARAAKSAPSVEHIMARFDPFPGDIRWQQMVLADELAEAFHAGLMVGIYRGGGDPFPHPYG